jgi:hypothetical protein
MFVYIIVNQETLKIYVGKTIGSNLNSYLRRKISDAIKGNYRGGSHLFSAMWKCPSSVWSIHPVISDLQTNEELCYWERFLIKALGSHYPDIGYNLCSGGEGHTGSHTLETRLKMSKAWTKERKQALREWNSSRKFTLETIEKLRQASLGRKPTLETCRKISKGRRGIPCSETTKEKIRQKMSGKSNPFFGKKHTEISRSLMRGKRKRNS